MEQIHEFVIEKMDISIDLRFSAVFNNFKAIEAANFFFVFGQFLSISRQ